MYSNKAGGPQHHHNQNHHPQHHHHGQSSSHSQQQQQQHHGHYQNQPNSPKNSPYTANNNLKKNELLNSNKKGLLLHPPPTLPVGHPHPHPHQNPNAINPSTTHKIEDKRIKLEAKRKLGDRKGGNIGVVHPHAHGASANPYIHGHGNGHGPPTPSLNPSPYFGFGEGGCKPPLHLHFPLVTPPPPPISQSHPHNHHLPPPIQHQHQNQGHGQGQGQGHHQLKPLMTCALNNNYSGGMGSGLAGPMSMMPSRQGQGHGQGQSQGQRQMQLHSQGSQQELKPLFSQKEFPALESTLPCLSLSLSSFPPLSETVTSTPTTNRSKLPKANSPGLEQKHNIKERGKDKDKEKEKDKEKGKEEPLVKDSKIEEIHRENIQEIPSPKSTLVESHQESPSEVNNNVHLEKKKNQEPSNITKSPCDCDRDPSDRQDHGHMDHWQMVACACAKVLQKMDCNEDTDLDPCSCNCISPSVTDSWGDGNQNSNADSPAPLDCSGENDKEQETGDEHDDDEDSPKINKICSSRQCPNHKGDQNNSQNNHNNHYSGRDYDFEDWDLGQGFDSNSKFFQRKEWQTSEDECLDLEGEDQDPDCEYEWIVMVDKQIQCVIPDPTADEEQGEETTKEFGSVKCKTKSVKTVVKI